MHSSEFMQQDGDLIATINAIVEPTVASGGPGASIIVARNGQVVFRKGYGLANIELAVPIEPQMIFRLGSITKQFTAVAILMLVEQGKLELTDPLTKFLPDYPTQGHTITVEHLLTHTSGIKSYTGMAEWLELWRKDFTPTELIDLFKDQPMDFVPGEQWAYNNSAYVLLGAIIEQCVGCTYTEFIEQQIFAPLGMSHSSYDVTSRIVPGRVAGYGTGPDGLENAAYLSMTQPYAAGSLMSSVDDLAIWDASLANATLVSRKLLEDAWTPYVLPDGNSTYYGYGWVASTYADHRLIAHGGGIHGFNTFALRLPDDGIFVAVLANNGMGDPDSTTLALKIAATLIGHPYEDPTPITLDSQALDIYPGVYGHVDDDQHLVTREDDTILIQHPGGGPQALKPISASEFYITDYPLARVTFILDAGTVTALELHDPIGPVRSFQRTEKPLPPVKPAEANLDKDE